MTVRGVSGKFRPTFRGLKGGLENWKLRGNWTGGKTVWSKGRGSSRQFPDLTQRRCGKKREQADNGFAGIHQSGRFPKASDFGHSPLIGEL